MRSILRISIIIIIQLFCSIGLSYSQYLPILQDTSRWHVYHWFEASCNETYQIIGDSIINNNSYKILKADPYCNWNASQITLLREDTLEKKVYQLQDTTEYIIYNFGLEVGDTFFYTDPYCPSATSLLVLDSIADTISEQNLSVNIIPLRVYYFSEIPAWAAYSVVWIEGLGSLSDLVMPDFPWGGGILGNTLLCHFKPDGSQDFHYIFFEEPYPCEGPILHTDEISKINKVEFFPNPNSSSEVKIVGRNLKQIELKNLNGQTILEQKLRNIDNTLNISKIKIGLYFLKITYLNGQYEVKKFIKI